MYHGAKNFLKVKVMRLEGRNESQAAEAEQEAMNASEKNLEAEFFFSIAALNHWLHMMFFEALPFCTIRCQLIRLLSRYN